MKTARKKSFPSEALKQGFLIVWIAIAISLLVNHFRPDRLPLIPRPASPSATHSAQSSAQPLVSLEEAQALFLAHAAVFIDARPEPDYRAGHIKGALNLPANNLQHALPRILTQVSPHSFLIAYCDGVHCALSREVALQLSASGYPHVAVLANGWSLWRDAGLPETKGR